MTKLHKEVETRLASKNPAHIYAPKLSALKSQVDNLVQVLTRVGLHAAASELSRASYIIDSAKNIAIGEGDSL